MSVNFWASAMEAFFTFKGHQVVEFLAGLFLWVCLQMQVDPKSIPVPKIVGVTPQEMSAITCGVIDPRCPITPAGYDGNVIYIIEDLDFQRNKEFASFIIHHLVHYVQYTKLGKNPKQMKEKFEQYEKEALDLQKRYLSLLRI